MKRALSWLLAIALVVSLATPVMAANAEGPFPDVGANNRFAPAIQWAADEGIASGYGNGEFRPNNVCTRGNIVMFLWNMAGNPEPTQTEMPFSDVSMNNRYAKAILWAVEYGVTSGYGDGTFRMDYECSRQHAVQFLYNYFGNPYVEGESSFPDVGEGNRFKNAIVWAASYGVASGRADGNFDPEDACTRAHIAQFLYNTRPGTKANPIQVMPEDIPYTFEAEVAAGQTVYYMGYGLNGMILSVDGVEVSTLTAQYPMMPVYFEVSNETEENAVYEVALSYPIGSQMNPEVIFRPAYIPVNVAEGNTQGYYYTWTSNADGTLVLTLPETEVAYGVDMTNMSTYASAWSVDSTDGTMSLEVSAGDQVIIHVAAEPDANWNYPALETALTGEFVYPIGSQMNPEVIFRPAYIPVNVAEGNTQGYYYTWTSNADGTLVLTLPETEVAYGVDMTNMSTYASVWSVDSTDGTMSLEVSAGDQVIIHVAADPDANWNYPALETALSGEFVYPIGSQMNPEVITGVSEIAVAVAEGNTQGYFYSWTSKYTGSVTLTLPEVEGVAYGVDMTNMSTYASAWSVDSTDGTITLEVSAGDQVVIHVAAEPDANWNYPALNVTLTGSLNVPAPETAAEIVEAAYALENGESLPYTATLTGEITKINTAYSSSYGNISVTIVIEGAEDYPILCYRLINNPELELEYSVADLAVGDIITVTGVIKNYGGTVEFDAKCTMDAIVKGEGEVPVAPEDPAEIIDAAYALEQGASLPYSATLTGKITEIKNAFSSQYNNITVIIEVEGSEDQPIICYRMKGTGADVIAVGDTITVTGTIKNYYGDIEFDSGCTLDSYVKAEGEEPEISAAIPPVSAPEADTAYKFGLIQVKNGTTVYVTGEVSGRYLATTQDKAAAVDVYAEAVEGGYKFYILVDDVKSYIQIYLNESNQISVQYAAEGSVYAYNAETYCWYTNVNGTDYYLGSYNTFETISASKTSYISADNAGVSQFPAGFFTAE